MLRVLTLATALALSTCTGTAPALAETCVASEYGIGDHTQGGPTASGQRFNTYATNPYTVAHKHIRLGSTVTITNKANGKSIRARVTDRGPYIRGRCVDLGHAGAVAIGMSGLAQVDVQ